MNPVRTCAGLAVLLFTLATALPSNAQVSFDPSGKPVDEVPGRGVALADFNGDGALDAFVVAHVTWESCESRLYLGDGRGQFTDSGQRLSASQSSDQPLAYDIDSNGTKDVLIGRTTWMNDGRGRFSAGPAILVDADGAAVRGGRLADLDGDGAVDLLVTAMVGPKRTNAIRLYLNDRKGAFREAGQTLLPGITSAIAIGDVNADRIPDVVVSGWRNAEADECSNRVLLNDGKGHLSDTGQQLDEKMDHSHSLALDDMDGDGDLDVVLVTQGQAPSGGIYLNDGKGRFTAGARIGTSSIEKVALADFDGDGDLDVFLACIGPDEVWVNDGRAAFTDAGVRLGKAWSWELALGDFNGDRLPDVFVASFRVDRAAPQDKQMLARPLEVWLNTSRRQAPASMRLLSMSEADWDASDRNRETKYALDKALDSAGIRPGMTVGEVGAGAGYIVFKLAVRVGSSGRVYAEDIHATLLDMLKTRADRRGLANIVTVVGAADDPRMPAATFDRIFMHATIQFIDDPVAVFKALVPSLKPGGKVVVIERWRKEDIETFRRAGFKVDRTDDAVAPPFTVYVLSR